jgi:tRNA pseudouridine38-40 synthase
MRIALGVEYDGSGFAGWQTQPSGQSVQDALQMALSKVADAPVEVVAAGRTDAGVHATGQVVHFDVPAELLTAEGAARPLSAWVRGTNAHLPAQVSVLWARAVPRDFHARFSATGRSYRYVLVNRPSRLGLMAATAGWFHAPLDVAAMQAAAPVLLGQHDFSSFRASECQAKSPVRNLRHLTLAAEGDTITFHLEADAFLHHMVRNIVGALVYVGKDPAKYTPEWLASLLSACDRRLAPPTFSAAGLYLAAVSYDARFGLPQSTSFTY